MPASVMTMPEATKAAQMHAEGYSQPQIAAALGRSRKAVRTAFRQLDIQPRNRVEGYRSWLQLRGGKGPHDGGAGAFGRRAQRAVEAQTPNGTGQMKKESAPS